jgi:hypothetical protein
VLFRTLKRKMGKMRKRKGNKQGRREEGNEDMK